MKDHKSDFPTNPKVRLINPSKPELGRVAMLIIDNMVKEIRSKNAELKQATNTKAVLEWFKSIKNKRIFKFIMFDIESFYPSITPELLEEALRWAAQYTCVSEQQKKVVFEASKSFLYSKGDPWVKRGEINFDIGMGAYHGAQACEIVGLYLLSKLVKLPNFQPILYRDDGLGITSSTPRQTEKLKQSIIKIFKEQNLSITIEVNLSRVNFLDVTLDLEKDEYKPYRKPGDRPQYASSSSNHPPRVLKNIPVGINQRLFEISSNKEVFLEAIPPYQEELVKCGYQDKLAWLGEGEVLQRKKRKRSHKVIWFNPPYSLNVQTNVGREFLNLLDKHFPRGNPLHKHLNRNKIKISYRCLPNMGRKIANHNSKILRQTCNPTPKPQATCNCQKSKKADCPIPGACNQAGVVYEATVATADGRTESYVGLARNFKRRWPKHKSTLQNRNADGQTTLSNYVHKMSDENLDRKVTWKVLDSNIPDFDTVTGTCKLCTREKFQIALNPSVASLNSRIEIFSHCRHKALYILGDPPD